MGWNEWPLIVFTVLAQTAIGAFWVHAYVLLGNTASSEQRQKLARGSLVLWLLMAVAFAASTAHLGMPLRAINSLARVGSAPLSNEILTGGAFFALGGLGWLLSVTGKGSAGLLKALTGLTLLASVAFLICMARFYMIDTVPTWNTPLTPAAFMVTALIAGLLLGRERLAAAGIQGVLGSVLLGIAALALLAGVVMTLVQQASLPHITSSIQSAANLVPDYAQRMAGRFALLAAALAIWLGAERRASLPAQRSLATVALVLVLVGEMLGRSVFYGLHMTVGL